MTLPASYGEKNDEASVTEAVVSFGRRLASKNFDGLWVPTHFAMDAECDDFMCLLLLEYIHRCSGSKLRSVLVQLPTDDLVNDLAANSSADVLVNDLAAQFTNAPARQVLRDPD